MDLCGFIYHDLYLGGFNHLKKYESQWEGLSHTLWEIKMIETTTQKWIYVDLLLILSQSFGDLQMI